MASAPSTQEMLMEAFQTALRTPQTVVVLPETDPTVLEAVVKVVHEEGRAGVAS